MITHWKLLVIVKIEVGITTKQHLTEHNKTGWQQELFEESLKGQHHAECDPVSQAVGGECTCLFRTIQDAFADERTPYVKRFKAPFHGPNKPFGAEMSCKPRSEKDIHRIHQSGNKRLPGMFMGHALPAQETCLLRTPSTVHVRRTSSSSSPAGRRCCARLRRTNINFCLPSMAGGDSHADNTVPWRPHSVEIEATEETHDFRSIFLWFPRSAVHSTGVIVPDASEVHRRGSADNIKFGHFGGRQQLEYRWKQNSLGRLDRMNTMPNSQEVGK